MDIGNSVRFQTTGGLVVVFGVNHGLAQKWCYYKWFHGEGLMRFQLGSSSFVCFYFFWKTLGAMFFERGISWIISTI